MASQGDSRQIFIDPVCLKAVPQGKFHRMFTYQFRTYYFCTKSCREAFMTDPEKYVRPESKSQKREKRRYLQRLKKEKKPAAFRNFLLFLTPLGVFILFSLNSPAYAHGPAADTRGGKFQGNSVYAMMGGGGMGGGRGMGGWFESLQKYARDAFGPSRDKGPYNDSNTAKEIETLRNQITAKRKELAALYRSKDADKVLIEKKIDELGELEGRLDRKISTFQTTR